MTLNMALDLFLTGCRLRGLSDNTIRDYSDCIRRFMAFKPCQKTEDLNYEIVAAYINKLYAASLSRATVATYLRHLKIFIRWLGKEGYIEPFVDKIQVPKTPKKVLRIYSNEEMKLIFSTIDISTDWLRYRNCAIVALMYDSGLRRNEVCEIRREDLRLQESLLKVCGKGNKERLVPLGKLSIQFITSYLSKCPFSAVSEKMFVSRRGNALTNNAIKLFISKLAGKLPFEFSCHKLRHNFATMYCINQYEQYGQVDIYKLMILMGHEDTLTTRRYLHIANQVLASKSNISQLDKVFLGRQ